MNSNGMWWNRRHAVLKKLCHKREGANPSIPTVNVPHPIALPVGADVRYRNRMCTVIVRSGDMYMIKDKKNRQTWWVRPDHVEIATLM